MLYQDRQQTMSCESPAYCAEREEIGAPIEQHEEIGAPIEQHKEIGISAPIYEPLISLKSLIEKMARKRP